MEQEKELLQNQNVWLNSELKSKTDELLTVSREKGKEILELKSSLESKNDEVPLFFFLPFTTMAAQSSFKTHV